MVAERLLCIHVPGIKTANFVRGLLEMHCAYAGHTTAGASPALSAEYWWCAISSW